MRSNKSVEDWIRHENERRRINAFYIVLSIFCVVTAIFATPLAILVLLVVSIFAGMSNLIMLLGTPTIQGSDEDIRAAASCGPEWFRRLISKLDSQN